MLYGLQAVPEALVFRLEFVGKHHDMTQGNFAAACCKIVNLSCRVSIIVLAGKWHLPGTGQPRGKGMTQASIRFTYR